MATKTRIIRDTFAGKAFGAGFWALVTFVITTVLSWKVFQTYFFAYYLPRRYKMIDMPIVKYIASNLHAVNIYPSLLYVRCDSSQV